jgi:hypothetical protein
MIGTVLRLFFQLALNMDPTVGLDAATSPQNTCCKYIKIVVSLSRISLYYDLATKRSSDGNRPKVLNREKVNRRYLIGKNLNVVLSESEAFS